MGISVSAFSAKMAIASSILMTLPLGGVESILSTYHLLDMTPMGRQEAGNGMNGFRLNDEYGVESKAWIDGTKLATKVRLICTVTVFGWE